MRWKDHKERWIDCTDCSLCYTRNNVVLLRGTIPCDVLFIGEAPGVAEDVLGKPFVGPAGKLLDQIIKSSQDLINVPYTTAFSNVVACIPFLPDSRVKVTEPPKEAIDACWQRLCEVVELCDPTLIVTLGKTAQETMALSDWEGFHFENLPHPAWLLRQDITTKDMKIKQSYIKLADAVEEYLAPFKER